MENLKMKMAVSVIAVVLGASSLAHALDLPVDGAPSTQNVASTKKPASPSSIDHEGFEKISDSEAALIESALIGQYPGTINLRCKQLGSSQIRDIDNFGLSAVFDTTKYQVSVFRRLGSRPALKVVDATVDKTITTYFAFDSSGNHIIEADQNIITLSEVPAQSVNKGSDIDPKMVTIPAYTNKAVANASCSVVP